MAKFYGTIGYAERVEVKPGDWRDVITEREYYGDYVRNISSKYQSSGDVNDNIIIDNNISIVADPYAYQHFHLMKYVVSMGTKWKIERVDPQYPRIILTTGGVYNG